MASDDWQKYLGFRCTGCGNCCRGTIVMVTDADMRRLEQDAGRPLKELVRFVNEGDVRIEKRSPWWIRLGETRAVLALRHRQGGACTFLDDDNRCTIYEHRPIACREHPLDVTVSDRGAVEHIALSDIVECPHDWDGKQTRRELRALNSWNAEQSDAYLDEVERWNRLRSIRKTRPGFLRYLGFDS